VISKKGDQEWGVIGKHNRFKRGRGHKDLRPQRYSQKNERHSVEDGGVVLNASHEVGGKQRRAKAKGPLKKKWRNQNNTTIYKKKGYVNRQESQTH